jgi:hypothetical protein
MKLLNAQGRTLATIVAFGILLPLASAKTSHKIKLPPPGNSVRIEGKLRGMDDHKDFIFQGDRGTKIKIVLTGAGPLRGEVTFPSAGHEGGPGGSILDQPLPETGQYQVRVSESAMGEAWKGSFIIEISVAQ